MDSFDFAPYLFLIVSLMVFTMALYVFLLKKPLILNSRWMLILIILSLLPQVFLIIEMHFKYPSYMNLFFILTYCGLIAWYAYIAKGVMIFGVDGDDFPKVFIECLNDKNYEFEQTLSRIKIKNPELDLSISIQSWLGTVQLRLKKNSEAQVLNEIIKDLNSKALKPHFIFPSVYCVLGIILTIISISMIVK